MLVHLTFTPKKVIGDEEDAYAFRDNVEGLVGIWIKHGHLLGEPHMGWRAGSVHVYGTVPAPDALERQYWQHSPEVVDAYERWQSFALTEPNCERIDDEPFMEPQPWQDAQALYLFAHHIEGTSSVCAWETGEAIPAYLLPLDDELNEDLYFWTLAHANADNLWLQSGALEMEAYREMADPYSTLSVAGRAIAARIELLTGKPTYYFLHRYYGWPGESERGRRCPNCGQLFERDAHPCERLLTFRCVPCRLATEDAHEFYYPDYALIGEYVDAKSQQ